MTEDLFTKTIGATGVTQPEVHAELQRELAMRRRVFPQWVDRGKLDGQTADHRIRCIEAALELLAEKPQLYAVEDGELRPVPNARMLDDHLEARVVTAQREYDQAARSGMMTLASWRLTATRMADALAGRELSVATAGPVDAELAKDTAERLLRQLCERLMGTPVDEQSRFDEQSRSIEDIALAIETHALRLQRELQAAHGVEQAEREADDG